MTKHLAPFAAAVLAVAVTCVSACGRGKNVDAVPDEATFYLQGPEDDAEQSGSTTTQAACVSTDAHDKLATFIADENDAIHDRIALLKAMVRAGNRVGPGGEISKTVTKNGATATLDVKNAGDGTIDYSVTFTPAGGTASKLLTGTSADDLSSGSWDFQGLTQNRKVHVDWTNTDGTLTVNRDATGDFGERKSTYVRTATDVTITFSGPNHNATAHWDRTKHDGDINVDGTDHCFAADPQDASSASAYCTIDCAQLSGAGEGEGEGEGEGAGQ